MTNPLNDHIIIRPISAAATRPMRKLLLRPDLEIAQLDYPGDDEADSLHVGAYQGDILLGIASIYRQPPKGKTAASLFRLRGMATLPEVRGAGAGGKILRACIGHAARRGGHTLWCDARVGAVWFYEKYAFQKHGEIYLVPNVGPHYYMARQLTPADAALTGVMTGYHTT